MQSSDDRENVTPLHIAAGSGHLACLQLLIQLGGDIMARDAEQLTPVDYAGANGQDLCLNYLNDVLGICTTACMHIIKCTIICINFVCKIFVLCNNTFVHVKCMPYIHRIPYNIVIIVNKICIPPVKNFRHFA